ncbi:phage tail tube protein [Candidatus Kirkpatrickella diaphorinae]|uniref:Phage tail tube protein n=1 Tax=Candidatus Kirkpatrickella diaphorinae TaxID=2984322 RepID=A0ABY6GJW0_9PROT|nr:phage tail tube protein [Candidatus Kirkpatrickella diaphorinae]UYH51828.1 phage tail tube protein [Candidatus Kirkpatrickella diaphorinae]
MAITGPTSGYAAGEQTNLTQLDYAQEIRFGVAPSDGFRRLRHAGETLAVQDITATPDEINAIPEEAETVLTGRSTSGSISGLLSNETYDDFIAAIMGIEWSEGTTYQATDDAHLPALLLTYEAFEFSTYENYSVMSDWPVNGLVKIALGELTLILPYTTRIIGKHGSSTDTLSFSRQAGEAYFKQFFPDRAITERIICPQGFTYTPVGIVNGSVGKTFALRKTISDRHHLFTGNMVSQIQLNFQAQQTPTIQMDFIGANLELTDVSNLEYVAAATTTRIMEAGNFSAFFIDGTSYDGAVQSATLTLTRNGAAQDQALGGMGAAGIQFGALKVTLEAQIYFRNDALIQLWQSGRKVQISFSIVDDQGKGYQFILLNAQLFNFTAPIDQKNKTMILRLPFTAHPYPGGGTIAVHRIG